MDESRMIDELCGLLREVAAQRHLEETMHDLILVAADILDCKHVALLVVDPESEYLKVKSHIGLSHTFARSFKREAGVGTLAEILWTGRARAFATKAEQECECADMTLEAPLESVAAAPVVCGFRTLGLLHVGSEEPDHFPAERLRLVETFAALIALAMDKQALLDACDKLRRADELTGLLNHRAFFEELEEEAKRTTRTKLPFSVLLMDIDNTKEKCRTYGNEVMGMLIRHVGGVIGETLRSTDTTGRYGPDEFAAILPGTGAEGAREIAERVCEKVAETTDEKLSSTVSIGAISCAPGAMTIPALIEQLKVAVFKAQRAGRNRVVLVDRTGKQ